MMEEDEKNIRLYTHVLR